ncbi:MAG TPA: acyl-CoA ligase (AMP-forming), exosortase A system-associated, partial [Burkholderiaceae bacterium]|nr:acyl-CoA ligase (AMP-forming), exosortase A system-associated [Burkholderiaceae bacterium]
PHATWGEAVVAVVTARDGAALDRSRLEAMCKERMPAYMVPWRIDVRAGSLARNANGKIDRKSIGDAWRQAAATAIET